MWYRFPVIWTRHATQSGSQDNTASGEDPISSTRPLKRQRTEKDESVQQLTAPSEPTVPPESVTPLEPTGPPAPNLVVPAPLGQYAFSQLRRDSQYYFDEGNIVTMA